MDSQYSVDSDQPIRPFMYEPEPEDNSDANESTDGDDDNSQRLGNTAWCLCGNCQAMPTTEECVCCREIEEIREEIDSAGVPCITVHPGFDVLCLNEWVLRNAYYTYRQQYGSSTYEGTINEQHRHTAYRQLVWMCWGWLGRNIRVTLPACAVTKIRHIFPSVNYTGFCFPESQ